MYNALSLEENFLEILERRGKIILNREWGRQRTLVISSPLGSFVFYNYEDTFPEGSVVYFKAVVKDFMHAGRIR